MATEIDGDGDTTTSIQPGDTVVKDGAGSATLFLKGGITIRKNGPGQLHLKGLQDYSPVSIVAWDGDGNITYSPPDVAPPTVHQHNGKGRLFGL